MSFLNLKSKKACHVAISALMIATTPFVASPTYAQQVSTLPVTTQLTLRTASLQGSQALLNTVNDLIMANPAQAQAVVNQAASLNPQLGQQILSVARQSLVKASGTAATSAAPRTIPTQNVRPTVPSRAPVSSQGALTTASASAGLSTGEWIVGGLLVAGAAAGTAIALGSGGGSNDTSGSSYADEFARSSGLSDIGVSSAYSRGATGNGILVGVVDSGIDETHSEFSGRIAAGGQNFITGRTASNIQDTPLDGHGTMVSGIIAANRDGRGTQGVAYEAQVLPLRIFEVDSFGVDYSGSDSDFADAFTYGSAQGVDVFNGSYGYSGTVNVSSAAVHFDAIEAAINAGAIAVFAAGNSGGSNPEMPAAMPYIEAANDSSGVYTGNIGKDYSATAAQLIAVAAAAEDGTIASYSNRCGIAANWCITAPGSNIYSTMPNNTFNTESGTSFAAPYVTGAVALLLDLYPSLTPAQIVTRLFTTATKTGIYADATVYGQGMLNLATATSFVARPMIATSASLSAPLYSLSSSALVSSSALGDSLSRSLTHTSFKAIDSFDGAPISIYANALVDETQQANNTLDDGARRFGYDPQVHKINTGLFTGQVSLTHVAGDRRYDAKTEGRFTTLFSQSTKVSVGYMDNPSLGFSLMADNDAPNQTKIRSDNAFMSPYLGFVSDGTNITTETKFDELTVRAGSFFGHAEDKDQLGAFGAATELSFSPFENTTLGISAGFVSEENSFLGSEGSGAMLSGQTNTQYVGFSAALSLNSNIKLLGSYYIGQSQMEGIQSSLFTSLDNVTSSAFTFGLLQDNLAMQDDTLGLIVNQPLRVSNGTGSLRLADGVDASQTVSYKTQQIHFSPSGQEVDVEAFYAAPLDKQTQLNTSVLFRHQPDHNANADDEAQLLIRLKRNY